MKLAQLCKNIVISYFSLYKNIWLLNTMIVQSELSIQENCVISMLNNYSKHLN